MNNLNAPADIDRIEGRQKVTGTAKYAAEYDVPGVRYGVLVPATITRGKITAINTKEAERAPGVVAVISHLNRGAVPGWDNPAQQKEEPRVEGQEFRPFFNNTVYFDRQPMAIVVADTFERATHAATMVKVSYAKEAAVTDMAAARPKAKPSKKEKDYTRGDADAWKSAPVKVEAEYTTPLQVHHPMETHAATIVWKGATKVTVYNKTQATKLAQQEIMKAFDLKEADVQVHSPFVGGAFGSSSRVWPEEMAALIAARKRASR